MDSAAVQQMQSAFLLWPSLVLTCSLLLPLSAACCWLKRNKKFDWPGQQSKQAAAGAAAAARVKMSQEDLRHQLAKQLASGPLGAGPAARPDWQYRWRQPGSSNNNNGNSNNKWDGMPPIRFDHGQ
jgi:hypothetical protein